MLKHCAGSCSTRWLCTAACSPEGIERGAVQVEKFNKALSRGVGASRVWRYLSGKGKNKNGVAGSVNGAHGTMDVDDMLTYSPVRPHPTGSERALGRCRCVLPRWSPLQRP